MDNIPPTRQVELIFDIIQNEHGGQVYCPELERYVYLDENLLEKCIKGLDLLSEI